MLALHAVKRVVSRPALTGLRLTTSCVLAGWIAGMLAASAALAQGAPPTPPRRPADLGAAPSVPAPSSATSGPLRLTPETISPRPATPPAGSAVAAPAAGALTQENAVERVNAYLNSFSTLIGDFSQLGADGRRYQGKLYVHRPGRMRFEYNPPATIQVIADGTTVAVRDRRLATQDNYLIGQTPLKFLLKERIDLRRDVTITRVVVNQDMARITMEDRSTLGGTSRITLNYDARHNVLREWVIVDPQGYETNVQVANLDTTKRPDPALFRINLERIIGDTRSNN